MKLLPRREESEMNKKESLRILKLLCNLETVVFENRTNVPDYMSDELLSVVELLTKTILEEEDE